MNKQKVNQKRFKMKYTLLLFFFTSVTISCVDQTTKKMPVAKTGHGNSSKIEKLQSQETGNDLNMSNTEKVVFRKPQVNFYVKDVQAVTDFYSRLGFTEILRTPEKGTPIHIELSLDSFILGIASIQAAREMHDIPAGNGGPCAEIAIWTDDVDKAFTLLIQNGAQEISKPHDFLTDLRAAWVYDPGGNPVQIVAKR